MKRQTWLSVIVLLSMVLIPLASPLAAQETKTASNLSVDTEPLAQAEPGRTLMTAPQDSQPNWEAWVPLDPPPFQWTRLDGAFNPADELIYFLGGRTGVTPAHDKSIWTYDPVAGLYVDTGCDMLLNASNYTMALIEDDGTGRGEAFYIVGGYDADLAQNIDEVQRYYPSQPGCVVEVVATDPYPDLAPNGLPVGAGGVGVVGGKIYAFGGWDSAVPYFSNKTWEFDPLAAAGDRWTEITDATLNPARAYINSAVQGNLIYAMGGHFQYTGSDLVPSDVVEVFDPANPGAGWVPLSNMPVATAEGRGFGFGADTLGRDVPFGKLYVVGGGDWPDSSAEVMEYDVATDAWNQLFPDLNSARRNHAGVFVPLETPDDDGLPGMWVFGGRLAGDAPPFGVPEYYTFPPPAPVELIPPIQGDSDVPGAVVSYTLTLANNLGYADTFSLTYDFVWSAGGPEEIGPVDDGASQDFKVAVTIPADANCFEFDVATVTALAHSDPVISDTATLRTTADPAGVGNLIGTVVDTNTGLGIADAHVYMELGDVYTYTWAAPDGSFMIEGMDACTYDGDVYAYGYYNLDLPFTFEAGMTVTVDVPLDAGMPNMSFAPVEATVPPTSTRTLQRNLTNDGTGALSFYITELPSEAIYPAMDKSIELPSGVDPQVYNDLAASPDGMAKFVVYLGEQADLSAAFQIEDRSERGQYVLDALQAVANRTQAGLRSELDRSGFAYESRYIVNALVVEANLSAVESIAALPEVAYIGPNIAVPAPEPAAMSPGVEGIEAVEWNVSKVRADEVWSGFGVTGTGIIVSNIDTGVLYDHAALVNQYRGNAGGGTFDHNYNWWDPYGYGPTEPYDWHSHGSHTMGTMLGDDGIGNQIGMAPGATWLACQGFDQFTGYGYNAELLECAEFILAPWDLNMENPNPDLRPDVVNNSWGGGQAQWWYNQAVYAWRAAGIFPSFSAGNEGPLCSTTGDPGDMANVMASGATDINDLIASFSSRGPALISGITKPNVSAPGVNIRSAYNTGGYGLMGGTSMAAPHTAAEAALIWAAEPDLRGDVQVTSWIIEQTAVPILDDQCGPEGPPNNVYGWGRIDAYEAVSLALSSTWDISWLAVDPFMGELAPGESVPIGMTFDSAGLTDGECYTSTLKIEFNDPYVMEEFVPVRLCVGMMPTYLPIVIK